MTLGSASSWISMPFLSPFVSPLMPLMLFWGLNGWFSQAPGSNWSP